MSDGISPCSFGQLKPGVATAPASFVFLISSMLPMGHVLTAQGCSAPRMDEHVIGAVPGG